MVEATPVDAYWSWGPDRLGAILMEVRAALRARAHERS